MTVACRDVSIKIDRIVCLDTEVLPIVGELLHAPTDADRSHSARQALHDFIAAIYRSN